MTGNGHRESTRRSRANLGPTYPESPSGPQQQADLPLFPGSLCMCPAGLTPTLSASMGIPAVNRSHQSPALPQGRGAGSRGGVGGLSDDLLKRIPASTTIDIELGCRKFLFCDFCSFVRSVLKHEVARQMFKNSLVCKQIKNIIWIQKVNGPVSNEFCVIIKGSLAALYQLLEKLAG